MANMLTKKALCREIVRLVEKKQGRVNINWTTKPAEWPDHIPYVDPNNKMPNGKKPSKAILVKIHTYLVSKKAQGSPTPNVELSMQTNLSKEKDIEKGTCSQLQEFQKGTAPENARGIINSPDQLLQVMPTEAESLGIQLKKPENDKISSEQDCDVIKFLDIRNENSSSVTGEPMTIQTPFASGEHMTTDKPHDTGEPMAIQTFHDTGEPMAIQAPHASGEHMAIQASHDAGYSMVILEPAPNGTGGKMATETSPITNLLEVESVIPFNHQTQLMSMGMPSTIGQAPNATGGKMATETPPITNLLEVEPDIASDKPTHMSIEMLSPIDDDAYGMNHTNSVKVRDDVMWGMPVPSSKLEQAPNATGGKMATETPPITNLLEVEPGIASDKPTHMSIEMLSPIDDDAYGMNHTNSVIVGNDVMWGMPVPSSKLEQAPNGLANRLYTPLPM